MQVSEFMTPGPQTISSDETLETAIRVMEEHHFRHLPVVDEGELQGILSDRDVLEVTGWRLGPAQAKRVRDVMHRDVKTLEASDSLIGASLAIIVERVGCMPVLREGRLCGILTDRDLLSAFLESHRRGALEEAKDNPLVSTLMTTDLSTLSPQDSLDDALALCLEKKVRHVPIVEENRYRSLLSDRDLRGAIGREKPGSTELINLLPMGTVRTREEERISDVASAMVEFRISALPVVREDTLVGILTSEDLLEHCMNSLWR